MNDHRKYDIETGEELIRDVRPMTITHKGHSLTFDMPGWYPKSNDEGTFTDDDLKTYDKAINHLKAEAEHLLPPDEIRAIRKKLKPGKRWFNHCLLLFLNFYAMRGMGWRE